MNIARKFLLPALAVSLVLLIACSAVWSNRAWTLNGELAPKGTIVTFTGPEHCGWESASLLVIGSPLGSVMESGRDVNQYIRDPEGVFSQFKARFRATYEPDAELPGDAKFSGYVKNGVELWISQSQLDTAIYMVDGSRVERWPKAEPGIYCD